MPNFKQMPMTPSQVLLFPMSVEESVPRDSDVRVLGEAMDLLDWSVFEAGYSETGCPPYPPKVLAKVLVYGYSKGIRSSRALEDAVKNDKRYIWLAGGLEPDHTTIARFRKEKASELRDVYRGSVRICAEAGLILLDVTATDGSKIKARASKKSLYDAKRVAKEMEAIDRVFAEAEEVDRREDELYGSGTGNEMPAELADAAKRKEKLQEIAERLRKTGRNSASSTDEECRVMKTTDGLRPSYNVQVSIVAAERQAMIERLETPEGRRLYSLRQQTVEPVFGNIKANMGLSRFGLHGREGAQSETWLICIAHNLKIYARRRGAPVACALSCALVWLMGVAGGLVETKPRHDVLLAARAWA
jgi:transposase